jgi:hypothetical protein
MWNWLEKILGTDALVLNNEYKPKRARTKRGRYKGDDKSTADYNEAWAGGKAPKKKVYKIKGKKYTIKKRITKKR